MHQSRRRFLGSVAAGAAGGLAGCLMGQPSFEPLPPQEAGPDSDAFWQFRGGLQRQGVYPERSVPDRTTIDWRLRDVNTGDHTAAKASAVPAPDGRIVVPGDTGEVRAVTPDGDVEWVHDVGDFARGIHGTPTIANVSGGAGGSSDPSDGGTVYVGAYDGRLYAIDLETGDQEWTTKLGDAIGSSPGFYDDAVYVAVEYDDPSGAMFAVDAASGEIRWEDHAPTDHPHSTCAIDLEAGRLVVGANDGVVYGWSFPELDLEWTYQTGDAIKGPVATYDGSAFVGSWDHHCYRIDLEDGSLEWSYETGDMVMSGPAVEAATGTVYVGSHDRHLHAVDVRTGDRKWTYGTDGWIIGCPTVTSDAVLVGSYDQTLHAVDNRSGRRRWTVEGVGRASSTPLVTDDAIYFATRSPASTLESGEGPTGTLYRVVEA